MRSASLVITALVALVVTAGTASAQGFSAAGFDVAGYVAGEQRPYLDAPQFAGQLSGFQPGLVIAPELSYRTADRKHTFKLTPFVRIDSRDSNRTHFDVREAYWRTVVGDWEVLAGINTVFWGVTESRHLVDVINQIDFLEDLDGEDKLGQPMVNIGWQRPWGRLDAFVLFGFRELRFPGVSGRLRLPLPVAEEAHYPDGRRSVDFALRYSHYLGDFDLGVNVFHGTGREAAFVPQGAVGEPGLGPTLVPVYRTITQAGVDVQYTRDAWLWKLEAIVRAGEGRTFGAMVGGFEYTLYQFAGAADLGLLAEYLYDGRDPTAPPAIFDNDLFGGGRLALNDVYGTSLLAGAVIDLGDGSTAARLEVERRLTNSLSLELEGRFFMGVARGNQLSLFRNDSFLSLTIKHSF